MRDKTPLASIQERPTSFFWTVGDNLPATLKATGLRRRSNCEK
jgi:hypothetical protein